MPSLRRIRAAVAGLIGASRVDLADPRARARLRARIMLLTVGPAAVIPLLGSMGLLTDVQGSHGRVFDAFLFVVMAGATGLVVIRGARLGDVQFLTLQCLGILMGAVFCKPLPPAAQVPLTALGYVISGILAALLMERHRYVAAQFALTLAVLGSIAYSLDAVTLAGTSFMVSALVLAFTAAAMRLLRGLALNAISAARKGEVTDVLTGLTNRRGLERVGAEVWTRTAAVRQSVAALVVDVDHFKRINDTQGHAAGDEVLRRLGALLSASLREGDIAFRLGGEEFLLLCPTPPGGGPGIAERLRATIEREMAPVTVSIGVFESAPLPENPFPEALWTAVDTADQALYRAKNSGRNRTVAIT